jgi:S-adenosylmethionine hydrolase
MIIALLTDFGTTDYFVGAMKGAILSICETAKIVDITHEINPQAVRAASFTLRACYEDFPPKTIFIAVVDPGVGSNRRAILVETGDYFFVAPDNGLLSFVFDKNENSVAGESYRAFELTNEKFFARNVSRTFHGRDIFAPVAAHLANGVAPEEFGGEIDDFVHIEDSEPREISEKIIEAEIIHTDRFGNLITNLRKENLPAKFSIEIAGRKIAKLQTFFAEAERGEIFMIFGSAGFLEIVAFQASAQNLLKVKTGAKVFVAKY